MSTRGRKPKPTALKQLQGNPGKRPLPKREPKPKSEVKRPWGLRKKTRKFWDEHAEEMERLSILTGVDVPAFRLMAEHYALALQALDELNAHVLETGRVTTEGRDGPKKHPAAQVLRDNSQMFKSYATEFGMTPSARARLQLPADAEQLDWIEQLFEIVNE